MATRNYNTETTSPTTTISTINHSTDTTTSPATTLTTTPGFSPIETITTTNHTTDTTTSPVSTITTTNHTTDTTTILASIRTSTASPVTTKKPLHISIGVNYKGFIKYTNITDISTLSGTTTKISKYVINVGKLVSTSTSSTSTLIDIITPSPSVSPTTTKHDAPKPTSIPPINVYAANGEYYDNDIYLTYKATGAVYESGNAISLPAILTPAYDNSNFVFSSKYNWWYYKNGKLVEVNAGVDHEISLSVLSSTGIYIEISSSTSPTTTLPVQQNTTQLPSNTSTVLTDSTTSFPST